MNSYGVRNVRTAARLRVEALEPRLLLHRANWLVLDFTPDTVPDGVKPAGFYATFQRFERAGLAPRFLDFDGNGRVNAWDAYHAAVRIIKRTRRLFGGMGLRVVGGELWQNHQLGQKALYWGRVGGHHRQHLVDVIYVGGTDFAKGRGAWGVACQAVRGWNAEHYGYTFADQIANFFWRKRPRAGPGSFVNHVAKVIAHEAGHLYGLGHVYGHPRGDKSIMNYRSLAATARFPNRWYPSVSQIGWRNGRWDWYWGPQNPYRELINSFRYQPSYGGGCSYKAYRAGSTSQGLAASAGLRGGTGLAAARPGLNLERQGSGISIRRVRSGQPLAALGSAGAQPAATGTDGEADGGQPTADSRGAVAAAATRRRRQAAVDVVLLRWSRRRWQQEAAKVAKSIAVGLEPRRGRTAAPDLLVSRTDARLTSRLAAAAELALMG